MARLRPKAHMECPRCGLENPANQNFCGECGLQLPNDSFPSAAKEVERSLEATRPGTWLIASSTLEARSKASASR